MGGTAPYTLSEKGEFELNVKTSGLEVNGERLQGVGYERYLEFAKEYQMKHFGKITLHEANIVAIE